MKANEYKTLDMGSKIQIVLNDGYYIDKREAVDYSVDLYALFGFFVEILYSPENKWIEDISVVEHYEDLDPYLSTIELYELY